MDRIKIKAVGDLCLSNIDDPLEHVGDELAGADIVFGNLEGPLTGLTEPELGKCCVRSMPELAGCLRAAGFNALSLANNHICDFGMGGLRDTRWELSRRAIGFFGAGLDMEMARLPLIVEAGGRSVGFLGYAWDRIQARYATEDGYGVAPLDPANVLGDVKLLKKNADIVILSMHWGYEGERYPLPSQRDLARRAVNAGANLVLGHHPHVVQGIEEYGNGLIIYSLGNFVFRDIHDRGYRVTLNNESRKSFILDCEIWGDRVLWDIVPVVIGEDFKPMAVRDTEFKRHVKEELSRGFGMANYSFFWHGFRVRKDLEDEFRQVMG